jgi:ArsR family transcriptional regulator
MMITPLAFFKCLAEETRLKSLLLITLKSELCVCDLVAALQLSQPKISRHLADLRKCQILIDERRGRWVFYKLNPDLPVWAKNVLHTTIDSSPEYINDVLNNLTLNSDCC